MDKIIPVSHLGHDGDLKLARNVSGLDVIVGGHSHILLGDWRAAGLPPLGSYPASIKNAAGRSTLIVQSWEWAKVVGDLAVDFDASGKVIRSSGRPTLVAGNTLIQTYDVPDGSGAMARVRGQWSVHNFDITACDGETWVDAPKDPRVLGKALRQGPRRHRRPPRDQARRRRPLGLGARPVQRPGCPGLSADGSRKSLDPNASYCVVCNNSVAAGRDKHDTLANPEERFHLIK